MSAVLGRVPAWAITAVLGLAYVLVAPPSTDLAAAAYRSDLFARAGFTIWDNSWYGGHHLPAYSLLAPALGAWIGPQLVAALAMTAATALFARLIEGQFPARATRVAALWFALGASVALLANRVPYDLGLAIGLGSLLAARHRSAAAAGLLALLCSLASPVAGAFLALAYVSWALSLALGGRRRGALRAAALALLALVPIGALTVAFPEGGTQPFVGSAFYPALAGVLVLALLLRGGVGAERGAGRLPLGAQRGPRAGERARADSARAVLLVGALLYALALVAAFAIPTAVGGNADRLGALLAGPVAALALIDRRPPRPLWPLWVLAPALLYWQANAPVADYLSAASDPAVHASYYRPLERELRALGVGYGARPARIEAVPSTDHFEARYLAPIVPLARGWERQLDRGRGALFYDEGVPLTAARYRAWLSQQAVSYVALPDAPLDYSAKAEARLLLGGAPRSPGARPAGPAATAAKPPPYLREVWHSAHWRLFAVIAPTPLVAAPARMVSLTDSSFAIAAPRAGSYATRVRFSPYWALSSGSGCVREGAGGFTDVQAAGAGVLRVTIEFSLARVFDHGPRCT